MATIHDLANPSILTLPDDEALALMKTLRASRRTPKSSSRKQKTSASSTSKRPRATSKQLAAKLNSAQLLQLIQEMEARL